MFNFCSAFALLKLNTFANRKLSRSLNKQNSQLRFASLAL
ncbi:hypothetical protein SynROS8604_02249 [Synechococcus sp. ROS8604]|nr:hypothetical protein SynROS8604_02249 [Synechococcus sp. ROS8604]